MRLFSVRWEIEIDADTPFEAAQEALKIQRDPKSLATIFQVWVGGNEAYRTYDLDEDKTDPYEMED